VKASTYGARKRCASKTAEASMPGRGVLDAAAGAIPSGPYDPRRFTYAVRWTGAGEGLAAAEHERLGCLASSRCP